jgi:hypothetical protein
VSGVGCRVSGVGCRVLTLVRVVFQLRRNCLRSDELRAMHSVASTTNSHASDANPTPSSSGTPYLVQLVGR